MPMLGCDSGEEQQSENGYSRRGLDESADSARCTGFESGWDLYVLVAIDGVG